MPDSAPLLLQATLTKWTIIHLQGGKKQQIIIHISLFFDEIKVHILFPSKGFVQWNSISLAYLHSVRVLRLSANVKFVFNIV